ncbi:MAG TPA: TlpA disulfide reductase family protein [Gemmatimonadales bacterium]|nr:TlpA disulfide reductase family protein [Gemmatimonadales bacterium]
MRRWREVLVVGAALAGLAGPVAGQDAGIAVGAKAPAVSVDDLDGKPVDLAQFIGRKPVLLEFWATWCELCKELLPRVEAAHQEFGDRVEFIGVNVTVNQTPTRVRRYLATDHPPFRTLYDDQGTSIRAYQVPSTSYVVVVDAAGKVAYTGLGGTQDIAAVLRRVTEHR